ncbi:extracellular solute-binding protein [Paenibacillus qinlingensis]|uniref:Aldouronate transport system substrate-binding protein n=1 Tax=Paenibacillus qinlingensis TaxID=1837343 RepID=A0ABU1NNS3_9BACL|nr:extracellular solute-binding protein [Paenibacillus qinlingensis]MDR6549129.1 putative aldouronate transport system substrate-binding protein [Paenibacillus qinlingensis]
MKKLSMISLSGLLAVSVLAGCSSTNDKPEASATSTTDAKGVKETAKANEVVTLKYVLPGNEPKDWPAVKEAIDKKLQADGVNVKIVKEYIDWGAWEQKLNLKLSTGEEFDLFHVMNDMISLANYIGRGAVKDIGPEIAKYGPELKKAIPDSVWSGVQKDGKTFGIPSYWYEPAVDGSFTANRIMLNEAGVKDVPKTQEEMLAAMEKVMATDKSATKPYLPIRGGLRDASDVLHRAYDSYPFAVKDKIAFIDKDGKVKSWAETEEFKKDAAFFRTAYQKKLTNPDILVVKQEQIDKQIKSAVYPFLFGTPNDVNEMKKTYPNMKDEDFTLQRLNPDKPHYRMFNAKNVNAVAVNSKHPEAAVKLLNWLYSSQENYDLFMYGIEGKTYKKVGDRGIEYLKDTDGKTDLYKQDDWMIGNLKYIRIDPNTLSANKALFVADPNAKTFFAADFFFDPTSVKAEMSNIQAVYTSDVMPIYDGVLDYDAKSKAAIDKLKAAGIDKVIAEYQKQLDAYKASQK